MNELVVSSKVRPGYEGLPLVEYLSRRFTYLSEDEWGSRIREGRILLNQERVGPSRPVGKDDTVSYHMPDFEEPPADLNYTIVYGDRWLLGVDKPGNLLVHRYGRSFRSNLIYQLRHIHVPPYPHAHAVNRLDRGTSGIVMFALDTDTLSAMHRLFADRKVEKTYVAVVRGIPTPSEGLIDAPIGRADRDGVFAVGGAGAKESLTRYRLVRPVGPCHALVQLRPHTGRTHQIRVHLASLGSPVVGDVVYGGAAEPMDGGQPTGDGREVLPGRHALHCSAVRFHHPHTGASCEINAPLPPDLERLLESLESDG
jgi:23S rRNA pseudouridine1911/1915/1917 synthase